MSDKITAALTAIRNVSVSVVATLGVVEAASDVPAGIHAAAGVVTLIAHALSVGIDKYESLQGAKQ